MDLTRDEPKDLAAPAVAAERLGDLGDATGADVAQQRVDRLGPRPGRAADRRADSLGAGEAAPAQPPLPLVVPVPVAAVWIGPRRKIGPGRGGLPLSSRVTSTSRYWAIDAWS